MTSNGIDGVNGNGSLLAIPTLCRAILVYCWANCIIFYSLQIVQITLAGNGIDGCKRWYHSVELEMPITREYSNKQILICNILL